MGSVSFKLNNNNSRVQTRSATHAELKLKSFKEPEEKSKKDSMGDK